jgi:biotin-(acetyl-CoA carboxylase) ligase
VFEEHGFSPLMADYLGSWMHSGQQVQFQEQGERSVAHNTEGDKKK